MLKILLKYFLEVQLPYHKIEYINIHLATETFDKIEKDDKVTTEAALGLIGGTMGLFTGFSILSGIEIIYFFMKYIISFRHSLIWKNE